MPATDTLQFTAHIVAPASADEPMLPAIQVLWATLGFVAATVLVLLAA